MTDAELLALSIMSLRDAVIYAVKADRFAELEHLPEEEQRLLNGFLVGLNQREQAVFTEINRRSQDASRAIVAQFGKKAT